MAWHILRSDFVLEPRTDIAKNLIILALHELQSGAEMK